MRYPPGFLLEFARADAHGLESTAIFQILVLEPVGEELAGEELAEHGPAGG